MNGADPLSMKLVRRWAVLYTRGLPSEECERRCLELESDMWEHLHDPTEPDVARELFGRFMRGIPADVRWRYRTLLESRGARQRSQEMTMSIRRDWWVVLTAVLGTALLTMGAFFAIFGIGSDDESVGPILGAVGGLASGGLIIGGLTRRRRDLTGGTRLIFAGAVLTLIAGLEFIPIGVIVLISGLWTGNLRLSDSVDAPELQPVRGQQIDMTRQWFVWLAAATVLFAIGWLPLIFDDPDDLSSLGWSVWILSWLGAIVTGGVGVILAGLHLIVRHRTRPA